MGQLEPAKGQVAVVNGSREIIELLQGAMEDEGFTVGTGDVRSFKHGEVDLNAFLYAHRPEVVIWDIAIPYEENWHFFENVVRAVLVEHGCWYVLTTTNKAALERLVGPTATLEIVGKPFDLQGLAQAVTRLLTEA